MLVQHRPRWCLSHPAKAACSLARTATMAEPLRPTALPKTLTWGCVIRERHSSKVIWKLSLPFRASSNELALSGTPRLAAKCTKARHVVCKPPGVPSITPAWSVSDNIGFIHEPENRPMVNKTTLTQKGARLPTAQWWGDALTMWFHNLGGGGATRRIWHLFQSEPEHHQQPQHALATLPGPARQQRWPKQSHCGQSRPMFTSYALNWSNALPTARMAI